MTIDATKVSVHQAVCGEVRIPLGSAGTLEGLAAGRRELWCSHENGVHRGFWRGARALQISPPNPYRRFQSGTYDRVRPDTVEIAHPSSDLPFKLVGVSEMSISIDIDIELVSQIW